MITTILCCLALLGCCSSGGGAAKLKPALEMSLTSFSSTSAVLDVKIVNATHVRVLCLADGGGAQQPTAESVASEGKRYEGLSIEIDGLTPETSYTVFAVAAGDKGEHGELVTKQFFTSSGESEIYSWERARGGVLSFTDMVLCYGGSAHRQPRLWDKGRFGPFVSYIDTEQKEHWLFDSFLCLEFVTTSSPSDGQRYTYAVGYDGVSAGKRQWEEQLDYWLGANTTGVNALEAAVEAVAARLGAPPTKRKVVISMPDPIIHKAWLDLNSSTTYWGSLGDRALDFGKADDRVAAYRWFIDEVRKRFDEANYKYVELAGFYVISEELVSTDEGWEREAKKSWELFPAVADYLHSLNEALCWVPYNRATGYSRWKQFGIDYAYMQPNYFWDETGTKTLSRFFADIKAHDMAMELEFDDKVLEGQADDEKFRTRIREYMASCKSNGTYGTQPLSYYQDNNTLYKLWASDSAEDQKLYHEICQFVIGNPLRK